jgi:diguanylate cyclase (GGDEF)-like protein
VADRTSSVPPEGSTNWEDKQKGKRRATPASEPSDAQTLADREQTLADTDQTFADTDQSSSDTDQEAADSDQEASDRDLAHGGDSVTHDATRGIREQSSKRRGHNASRRAEVAGARDVVAQDRDLVAMARDEAAALQDEELAARDAAWAAEGRVAANRRRALADRAAAAEARARAAADRAAAARDREQAARDRAQAQADREALLHQLAIAETDVLTGARTRGPGLAALDHEIDRARRTSGELVVAYVDVVGLKAINDTHGHAAGDELLQAAVHAIRGHLRSYDLIARLGGDEFLCVMSGATLEEARQRFAAVKATLAADPDHKRDIKVGFAMLEPADNAADLIGRADAELLPERKRRGAKSVGRWVPKRRKAVDIP